MSGSNKGSLKFDGTPLTSSLVPKTVAKADLEFANTENNR